MSLVSKNTLGAGDGLRQTPNSKRTPVSSSRRFATRGVKRDVCIQRKLQEALEFYSTPPESPLKKRSATVAEITPSKKLQQRQQLITKRVPLPFHKLHRQKDEDGVAATGAATRIADAGRRVSHQLMLNAWRQRRRQVATLCESRDALQTQVNQLELQIEVLQKLRESEGERRLEALQERNNLNTSLKDYEDTNEELQQTIKCMQKRESIIHENINKLHVELMNERNNYKTLTNQKHICEEAFHREKEIVVKMREERDKLLEQVKSLEDSIVQKDLQSRDMYDVSKLSEAKFAQLSDKYIILEKKCRSLELECDKLTNEKFEMEDLLSGAKSKHEKMEAKLHDLKTIVARGREQRQQLMEENEVLKSKCKEVEYAVLVHKNKMWLRYTGELLVDSLSKMAYLLFPTIPPPRSVECEGCSIGLGRL